MRSLSNGTSGSATDVVTSCAAGTGTATWAMGMLFERLVGAEETAGLWAPRSSPSHRARPARCTCTPGRQRPGSCSRAR